MESLTTAIERQDWAKAHSIALSLSVEPEYVIKHQVSSYLANGTAIPPDILEGLISIDPAWTARAALSESSIPVRQADQHRLNKIGLDATELWLNKILVNGVPVLDWLRQRVIVTEGDEAVDKLKTLIDESPEAREACEARWIASERAWRWTLYAQLYQVDQHNSSTTQPSGHDAAGDDSSTTEEDAWGDLDVEVLSDQAGLPPSVDAYPSFFSFLEHDVQHAASLFASQLKLREARLIADKCFLDAAKICDQIPLHAQPSNPEYGDHLIALLPRKQVRRPPRLDHDDVLRTIFAGPSKKPGSFSDDALTQWYLNRVHAIDKYTGHVDVAMEFIQHGASFGVAGLEIIAEDLSLLSKLLYEAPHCNGYQWTLEDWYNKPSDEIVAGYLSGSTPQTLMRNVNRLVLPYLGVVESRKARVSAPHWETIISDAIRHWTLSQADDLPLLAAMVQSSSPTLKLPERMIKSDEELACIAIACLYTSSRLDQWDCMNKIFECMPAFPDADPVSPSFRPTGFLKERLDAAESSDVSCSLAHQLYEALRVASAGSLTAILDGLDDHLTTAEVLARWNVPVQLKDLVLKFPGNLLEQEKLATKMARQEYGLEMESEEEWEALMEGMIELSKGGRIFDGLEKAHLIRLFFSGLLTSGKFKLAKALFSSSCGGYPLALDAQEELVISASREYYDNADSGNQNVGEMKLAMDCLSATKSTPKIQREREFIEATSRLTSYKLCSEPGVLMTPIQIRLRHNKLDLIDQLLSTNETAYKHVDMILELVDKLGFGQDILSQIRTLGLIVKSASSADDFCFAYDTCQRMVNTLGVMKKRPRRLEPMEHVLTASEVVWKTCERLGTSSPASLLALDAERRSELLGHAIILCPPEEISNLLAKWRAIVIEITETRRGAIDTRFPRGPPDSWHVSDIVDPTQTHSRSDSRLSSAVSLANSASSLTGDLAMRAASKTFGKAASLFPFKTRNLPPSTSSGASTPTSTTGQSDGPGTFEKVPTDFARSSTPVNDHTIFSQPLTSLVGEDRVGIGADRLTTALSNKFTSGVGWLIGANEEL